MNILGLIPARGGSKGVPGKNIKYLGGKPLLQYSYEAAMESKLLSKTILSTDSEEIASVGRSLGIPVPFLRPPYLAEDTTPMLPVMIHALEFFAQAGENYDAICLLQPACPFRAKGLIDRCIDTFVKQMPDSLVTVLPVPHEYNPHWVFEINADETLRISTGESEVITRRQALPRAVHRDGAIYISHRNTLLQMKSILGKRIAYVENDPSYHANIDNLEDWNKAEEIIKQGYHQYGKK